MENLWQVNDLDLLINNYALKAELFDQFCLHLMTNLFWKMMQHKKQFFFFFLQFKLHKKHCYYYYTSLPKKYQNKSCQNVKSENNFPLLLERGNKMVDKFCHRDNIKKEN